MPNLDGRNDSLLFPGEKGTMTESWSRKHAEERAKANAYFDDAAPSTWHFTALIIRCGYKWDILTWVTYSFYQLWLSPLDFFFCWTPAYWARKGDAELALQLGSRTLLSYKGGNNKLISIKEMVMAKA